MLSKIIFSAAVLLTTALHNSGRAASMLSQSPDLAIETPFRQGHQPRGFRQNIPFRLAHNYFVNNTVKGNDNIIIRTKEEFDRYFGGAATMKALPSPIDFTKEGVIAVINKSGNYPTSLRAVKLTRQHRGQLVFTYREARGRNRQSYTTTPFVMVIVDKNMLADNTLKVNRIK